MSAHEALVVVVGSLFAWSAPLHATPPSAEPWNRCSDAAHRAGAVAYLVDSDACFESLQAHSSPREGPLSSGRFACEVHDNPSRSIVAWDGKCQGQFTPAWVRIVGAEAAIDFRADMNSATVRSSPQTRVLAGLGEALGAPWLFSLGNRSLSAVFRGVFVEERMEAPD